MKLISFCAAILALSFSASAMDASFREDWDSFRFGLGFADTDNYAEMQIVIVYRTKDGANLQIDRYGKPISTKSIDKTQLKQLMDDVKRFFSNSTSSHKINKDGPFPQVLFNSIG